MAVVQYRRWEEFQADDRAGKRAGHADQQAVGSRKSRRCRHPVTQKGKDHGTDQGDPNGLAHLTKEFAG